MGYTKPQIYNLAFGALLLSRQTTDPTTDNSNEVAVLNTHYQHAFDACLEDMDLDATSTRATLALSVTDPVAYWNYGYTYPSDCVVLRRLEPAAAYTPIDNKRSHVPKMVRIHSGAKLILTNQATAVAEYISNAVPLSSLGAHAGMAIAYYLAWFSAPLIVGKGSRTLRKEIWEKYVLYKGQAQDQDRRENFNFHEDGVDFEFVNVRIT